MFKKYINEFMRASKFAGFFALGMLIATGVVPAIFCDTLTEAKEQLVGSVFGILSSYCGIVLLLWIAEIFRTKRKAKIKAEKKAARMAAKKAMAEAEAQTAETAEE